MSFPTMKTDLFLFGFNYFVSFRFQTTFDLFYILIGRQLFRINITANQHIPNSKIIVYIMFLLDRILTV